MNDHHNLYIVLKVSPIFQSENKSEPYIVAEDFIIPFDCFDCQSFVDQDLSYNNHSISLHRSNEEFENLTCSVNSQMSSNFERCTLLPCECIRSLVFRKFQNKLKISIDAALFSLIMSEINRSKTFRKNILTKFYGSCLISKKFRSPSIFCELCDRSSFLIHIIVYLNVPKKNVLDYKWGRRLQILVNEKCELENAMAWLSTLGGAFSALGDTYIECAIKAGDISIKQLCIALKLGDPLTVCRCRIYLAMSLIQRGYYRKAKYMIRELYKFSVGTEGSKDFRLRNMCLAVWNRLRYLRSLNVKNILKE